LPHGSRVVLAIFDVSGRQVAVVVDEWRDAGLHAGTWDGRRLDGSMAGSGVYFARLSVGGKRQTERVIVAR
jgi:hypothetical protein